MKKSELKANKNYNLEKERSLNEWLKLFIKHLRS